MRHGSPQVAWEERSLTIAFIDVEASGLGSHSWPLEVGWAIESGAPVSLLIRPDPAWSADAWDPRAEALHGITRERILEEGANLRDVAERLNADLANIAVYSDAPDWDGFWLFRLFTAAGVRQQFAVQDFARLVRPLAGQKESALLEEASRLSPRRHRACADVRHLQTIHRLALGAAERH